MAKTYYLAFGSQNPNTYTGLAPTFTIFSINGISAIAAPGITETPAGTGFYSFSYAPTMSILFLVDGGASVTATDRYIKGALDPIQAVDDKIGFTSDSFGSTSADPTTMYGYLKRLQELTEGDATFLKSSGVWTLYSRGSSTLLRTKALTNSTTSATKTGQ